MAPDIGEHLVGAYLEFCSGCGVVSYDHSLVGEQGDIDVLGLDLSGRRVFAVEVKTHIGGLGGYKGQEGPKLRQQIERAQRFLESQLSDWDRHYAIWSPHVAPKTEAAIRAALDDPSIPIVDLVINAEFASRLNELSVKARGDARFRTNPAFRLLQILARSAKHGFEL
jgi:hypothetical protein